MDSIVELINHPEQLNKDTLHELRELVARYPYYRQRDSSSCKTSSCYTIPSLVKDFRKAALFMPDRRVLFQLIEAKNHEIQSTPLHKETEETEEDTDRTQSLIDNFLRDTEEEQPTPAP